MSEEHPALKTEKGSAWLRPWRVMLASLGTVVAGTLLLSLEGSVVTPIRLLLIFAGMVGGGWAVQRHLCAAEGELEDRVESAGFVAVYSLAGIIGFLGMKEDWTSGRIFFGFFIAVSITGSLLVLLPRLWRRLLTTVLVLLHFGGIVVASASSPTANGSIAWVPTALWAYVYHPYLHGMFLTNAYHFYAPDPGPSPLVWYRIEYADGSYRWLKFPDRTQSETPLHYQRYMGMTVSIHTRGPIPSQELFKALLERRVHAANFPPKGMGPKIPMMDDRSDRDQYTPPNDYALVLLSSYARHVCRFYPNPNDPSIKPVKVKIYRMSHRLISPDEIVAGRDPYDDKLKAAHYLGEYDTEGKLQTIKEAGLNAEEKVTEREDPFLYWAIPIEYLPMQSGDVYVNEEKFVP